MFGIELAAMGFRQHSIFGAFSLGNFLSFLRIPLLRPRDSEEAAPILSKTLRRTEGNWSICQMLCVVCVQTIVCVHILPMIDLIHTHVDKHHYTP
jgi:hypothetical protein